MATRQVTKLMLVDLQQEMHGAANEAKGKLKNLCLVCQKPFPQAVPYGRITGGGSNEAQCQAIAVRILASGLDSGVCSARCLSGWDKERMEDALAAAMEFEARMLK